MALLGLHPFQRFDLESLPAWRHLSFNNEHIEADEQAVNELESAFRAAVGARRLLPFFRRYADCGRGILARCGGQPLVYEILGEALARLVYYYLFLTKRGRSSLATEGSSCTWSVDPELLQAARRRADELERTGERTSEYYPLSTDPPLFEWVRRNVRPVIEGYVGSRAIAPHAHVRVVTTRRFAHTWEHLYREHAFGYFHWDEFCYSLPLIIYLDDVGIDDGPYSYIEASDKMPQNLTVRAFTQAITCKLLAAPRLEEAHRETVARLPRIFRGGETVGLHLDQRVFDAATVRSMTGAAGTAILSDGFSLVHGGGHPSAGRRRALFVAHRFPRKRLLDACASASRRWWRLQVARPAARADGTRNEALPH
jgi:hypothetical protein